MQSGDSNFKNVNQEGASDPLDVVAGQIDERFDKADKADKKAAEFRISAGLLLIAVRKRVEAGEAGEGVQCSNGSGPTSSARSGIASGS